MERRIHPRPSRTPFDDNRGPAAAYGTHRRFRRTQRKGIQRLSAIITSLQRQAAIYDRLATRDRLTVLTNRHAFYEALGKLSPNSTDSQSGGPAILLIDLDRLKQINDTFGHHIGEIILPRTARLRYAARHKPVYEDNQGHHVWLAFSVGVRFSTTTPMWTRK